MEANLESLLTTNHPAITSSGSGASSTDMPPPPEADFEDVVVRIRWQESAPTWTVNDAPVPSLAGLEQSLRRVARIKRDAPVILHPDPEVPLGSVIEVYDISRLVGFEKVQFAVSRNLSDARVTASPSSPSPPADMQSPFAPPAAAGRPGP